MSLFDKYIVEAIENNKIHVTGILHVGAHNAEELGFYHGFLDDACKNQILWIEGNPDKVKDLKTRGINNVYNAVIADKDGEQVVFNVANNTQSSSILPLGLHAIEHPEIYYIDKFEAETITLKTFFDALKIDAAIYNYWHLDIQGAELMALKGAGSLLKNVDVISIEVNTKEIYKGTPLIGDIDEYLQNTENLRDFGNFQRVLTKINKHGWGDALYLKKTNIPLITNENAVNSTYRKEDITQCEYVSNIGLMFLCDEIFIGKFSKNRFSQNELSMVSQNKTLAKNELFEKKFTKNETELSKVSQNELFEKKFKKNEGFKPLVNDHSVISETFERPKTIYVITEDLSFFIKSTLPRIYEKFILVTGQSTLTIPFEALSKKQTHILLDNPFLVKWYAQNLLFFHEKMDNWPLGFSFSLYREERNYEISAMSQELYLKSIITEMKPFYERVANPEKEPLIYVNMAMRNSRLESRWDCFNGVYLHDPSLIVDLDNILAIIESGSQVPRDEVWMKTSKAPFCLSPFGYGIDCHRTYEILAVGTIPIIRGRILHRLYTDMPVLYVEKWEDVTRSLLIKTLKDFSTRKFDYSRIKIKYWAELLRSF